MPTIATLAFNMKQERDEAVEKQKFVQNSVKSTKDMIRRN
jgi:hypothetical protein